METFSDRRLLLAALGPAEALPGHIQAMRDEGEAISGPSNIDIILAGPGNRDGLPALIQVPARPDEKSI
jgi:hypothetical protein